MTDMRLPFFYFEKIFQLGNTTSELYLQSKQRLDFFLVWAEYWALWSVVKLNDYLQFFDLMKRQHIFITTKKGFQNPKKALLPPQLLSKSSRPSQKHFPLRNIASSDQIKINSDSKAFTYDFRSINPVLSPQSSIISSVRNQSSRTGFKKHFTFDSTAGRPSVRDEVTNKKKQLLEESDDEKDCLRRTDCTQQSETQEEDQNKIKEYHIIRLLGKGRFGQVYLTRHRRTGFIGAMKIIEKAAVLSLQSQVQQKMIRQLTNEIKIQAYLRHPNLIQLYDFFSDQTRIYLFIQLGTQGHLYDMLATNNFSEETTSIVTRQIIEGINFMHSKAVIHRDIKLENIVFTFGMAKICDFGWSIYEPKSFRSTICGTPVYLSPEILQGKKYNQKIDIWAIGTLAHEMITGTNPFDVQKEKDLSRVIKEQFKMKIGSPQLKSFFNFILRKEPSNRPDGEILLQHPFITKYADIETAQELCKKRRVS